MVSIASLLNPSTSGLDEDFKSPRPSSTTDSPGEDRPPSPPHKKQKMSKDSAVFVKGKVHGELRFPPCELHDERVAAEHRRFHIYPMGQILEYPRSIPYNSDKKSFLEKTGRGGFEVFQYVFKQPNDDKEYTVMWDYNVGLVRVTPFFKCCHFPKTMPAKMLSLNLGLRDICHSITGGALVAQGYWMPFEAAKAVAATFCYDIRYALTPLFGLDFVDLCIGPEETDFRRMVIDSRIIKKCAEEANEYRDMSRENSLLRSPTAASSSSAKSTSTDKSQTLDSGYYTDSHRDNRDLASPGSGWTPINTPSSVARPLTLPSPLDHSAPSVDDDNGGDAPPNSPQSYCTDDIQETERTTDAVDDEYTEAPMSKPGKRKTVSPKRSVPLYSDEEIQAAEALMKMHMADASLRDIAKKHRSSSW